MKTVPSSRMHYCCYSLLRWREVNVQMAVYGSVKGPFAGNYLADNIKELYLGHFHFTMRPSFMCLKLTFTFTFKDPPPSWENKTLSLSLSLSLFFFLCSCTCCLVRRKTSLFSNLSKHNWRKAGFFVFFLLFTNKPVLCLITKREETECEICLRQAPRACWAAHTLLKGPPQTELLPS